MIAPEEVWTTFDETAQLLHRRPQTIRNLVSKHQLPRRVIKQGRSGRRVALLSYTVRERLRLLCWTTGARPARATVPPQASQHP